MVAVGVHYGEGAAAWGSDDGLNWDQIDLPGAKEEGVLSSVTPFGDGLVVIDSNGTVYIATRQAR